MPINFVPSPGDVLMCDFNTGFPPPEIVKIRKIIILSRTHIPETYIVVPLSSAGPRLHHLKVAITNFALAVMIFSTNSSQLGLKPIWSHAWLAIA